jgi:AsmA family protein
LLLIGEPKHFDVQLSSPRLDLSPFMAKEKQEKGAAAPAPEKPKPEKSDTPKPKFVFDEKPLPLDKMKETNGKVHVSFGELVLPERSFKDVDSNISMDHGKLIFDFRAAGVQEGTLQGEGNFVPGANGTADLNLKIDLANVRASLASEGLSPTDVPPLGLAMNIKIHGSSPRQMAAGANGQLLLTQGAGKTKSGLISAYGGGVLSQLSEKLNPFAKDDPFMTLDCTIARADIVNGQVTVKPVVIQTEKVTITADGKIDLHTEKLLIDFNTRPRKGIGVSPGMFTNPLIRLEGTLVSPRIGMGAKGVASGALAVATGGATVIAGGAVDRMQGEQDVCAKTLEEAKNPAAAKDAEKDAEKKK